MAADETILEEEQEALSDDLQAELEDDMFFGEEDQPGEELTDSEDFLSEEELNRKTIQIYNDLKIAKRDCNKEQKVIKVPNTEVFKIVSSILISRGITRIVNADTLIAL